MSEPDNGREVYLIPAASLEAQETLSATIEDGGLTEDDVEVEVASTPVNELKDAIERQEYVTAELESLEAKLEDVKDRGEPSGGIAPDSDRDGSGQYPGQDTKIADEMNELKEDISDLEDERQKLERHIAEIKSGDQVVDLEDALDDLSNLRKPLEPGDAGVECWPLTHNQLERMETPTEGDVFFFYCDNQRYRYAAEVWTVKEAPDLWEAISPDSSEPGRSVVIFDDVTRVNIDSSVIAELGEYELDSPVNVVQAGETFTHSVIELFGGLDEFIDKARREPINRVPKSSSTRLDQFREPETDNTTETNDNAIESSSPGETVQDGTPSPVNSGNSEGGSTNPTTSESQAESPSVPTEAKEGADATSDIDQITARPPWQELRDLLKEHKVVAVAGPSKTGKHQLVQNLVHEWFSADTTSPVGIDDRVCYTNFHATISYEEFVLGKYGEDGLTNSSLVTGPAGEFIDLAAAATSQTTGSDDAGPKFVLVVENFDVTDPATVFGPLWRPIRRGETGPDMSVTVASPKTELWLPDQFYVIGLVDTDRESSSGIGWESNRVRTYRVTPDTEMLRELYGMDERDEESAASDPPSEFGAASVLALEELNRRIRVSEPLGPSHTLGHGYLTTKDGDGTLFALDVPDLYEAWQYELLPQLSHVVRRDSTIIPDDINGDGEDELLLLDTLQNNVEAMREAVETLATVRAERG